MLKNFQIAASNLQYLSHY